MKQKHFPLEMETMTCKEDENYRSAMSIFLALLVFCGILVSFDFFVKIDALAKVHFYYFFR